MIIMLKALEESKGKCINVCVCIGGELPLPLVINGMLAKKNDHSMNET